MHLIEDWPKVVKKAWSVRLMILAGLLSAVEVAIPYLDGLVPIPPRLFAALAGMVTALAFVSRIVAQRSMSDGNPSD